MLHRSRALRIPIALGALAMCGLLQPAGAAAQGAGATGAGVLQLLMGGRAAALSGAYSAASGDVDVMFYNPSGLASMRGGAALSYQRHVQEIGVASAAAAFRVGRFTIGAGGVFLDAGSVNIVVPDPAFGGQTGQETGGTASASEFAGRVSVAMPLGGERLRVGAAAGFFSSTLADATQSAPLFDVGAQYDFAPVTFALSLRNLGGPITGSNLADADMPSEARLGAALHFGGEGAIGGAISADLVSRIHEERTGFAVGVEAGLTPAGSGIGAMARVGYNGVEGQDALGRLQAGGGISVGSFALDYALQNYEYFGALHRIGVRWTRR